MTMTFNHIAYMFYCLCAIALFATTIWILRNGRKVKVTESVMLLLILGGLIYDNFMLGVGSLIFPESQGLLIATIPRFAIHALCTPLLIMHAALSCGRLNVPGYRSRTVITWWGATTFMCILLGLLREIDPVFEYSVEGGIAGFRPAGDGGAPIAEVTTVFSLIVMGIALTRFIRWPWMLASATVILFFNIFFLEYGAVTNLGELILLSGSVATGAYAVSYATKERELKKQEALARRKPKDTEEELVTQ
jgi:hypothetical protein